MSMPSLSANTQCGQTRVKNIKMVKKWSKSKPFSDHNHSNAIHMGTGCGGGGGGGVQELARTEVKIRLTLSNATELNNKF